MCASELLSALILQAAKEKCEKKKDKEKKEKKAAVAQFIPSLLGNHCMAAFLFKEKEKEKEKSKEEKKDTGLIQVVCGPVQVLLSFNEFLEQEKTEKKEEKEGKEHEAVVCRLLCSQCMAQGDWGTCQIIFQRMLELVLGCFNILGVWDKSKLNGLS